MNHIEAHQEYLELYSLFNREPMETLEDRGDVIMLSSSAYYPGCSVLDSLEWSNGLVRETIEQAVVGIQA